MKLTSLAVKNFMGFKDAELPLDERGLVLVVGRNRDSDVADSNGSGKSALLVDAIPWALFGQTVREKMFGATSKEFRMDDVVNRQEGAGCSVSVHFDQGNNHYEVVRYRKDSEFGDKVFLYCNGANLTGENISETEEKIRLLTGLTYQGYCNSAVFAQGATKRLSQCTDSERRKILEDFSDMRVFDRAKELATAHHKQLAQEYEDLVVEHATLRATLDADEASKLDLIKLKKAVGVGSKDKEIEKLKVMGGAAETKLRGLAVTVEDNKLWKLLSSAQKEDAEQRAKLRQLEAKLKDLDRSFERFRVGDSCPECLRQFTKAEWADYREHIADERNSVCRALTAQKGKVLQTEKAVDECEKDIEFNNKVKKERAAVEKERNSLKAELTTLLAEQKEAKKGAAALEQSIRKLNAKLDKTQDAVEAAEKRMAALHQQSEEDMFAIAAFGKDLKDQCFDRLISFINDKLHDYSQWLTGGEIEIKLTRLSKDRIGVSVDVKDSAPSYIMSSGGQARRVDLCIALALQAAVEGEEQLNFSVIDEFDAGLDATGVDAFVEYLKQEAGRRGSVFVITHNSLMAGQFDNVMAVTRENGVSSVEEL